MTRVGARPVRTRWVYADYVPNWGGGHSHARAALPTSPGRGRQGWPCSLYHVYNVANGSTGSRGVRSGNANSHDLLYVQ